VALQGCGSTGYNLARELHQVGARLVVSDIDSEKAARLVHEFDAQSVSPQEIFSVRADILSPCALGGIINDESIEQLKVEVIVGSANNQLLELRHGDLLNEKNILYAPDYVANVGGVINGCRELLGWDRADAMAKVHELYDTMLDLLNQASSEGIPPFRKADQLAEQRLFTAKTNQDTDL
jgi:leucine dehydrogenase